MPYQGMCKMASYDFAAKHPKMAKIAAAAAEAPGVKEYLASDKCLIAANPLGLSFA